VCAEIVLRAALSAAHDGLTMNTPVSLIASNESSDFWLRMLQFYIYRITDSNITFSKSSKVSHTLLLFRIEHAAIGK